MNQSILNSTKKILGVAQDYQAFDLDIITHINSVLSTLEQLGVGPVGGFAIQDETAEWGDLFGRPLDPRLNQIKSYIYLRVRMLFDPPTNSFTINAMTDQVKEMEWRLQVLMDPIRLPVTDETTIIIEV